MKGSIELLTVIAIAAGVMAWSAAYMPELGGPRVVRTSALPWVADNHQTGGKP